MRGASRTIDKVLARITGSEDPAREYGVQLRQLVERDMRGREQAEIIAAAERKFVQFRRDEGKRQLEKIKENFAGKQPKTQPKRAARVKLLKGWLDEEQSLTGSIATIPEPSSIAEAINDDLQANYRRQAGGRSSIKESLSILLGDLASQRTTLDKQQALASQLLAALEESDAKPLQDLTWHKLDVFRANALPRRLDNGKLGTISWPPRNKEEQATAAKVYPQYADYLKAPDTLRQPLPPESEFYELRDPLVEYHQRYLREAVFKGEVNMHWSADQIHAIVEDAAELIEPAF